VVFYRLGEPHQVCEYVSGQVDGGLAVEQKRADAGKTTDRVELGEWCPCNGGNLSVLVY
jgi:hypothetical protein